MALIPMDDPDYETPIADPAMVEQLTHAMSIALSRSLIPNITTTADILSAIFTLLDHALRTAREDSPEEDQEQNGKEIERVLMKLMLEYGSDQVKH